jgi:hypothetical protein
MVLGLGSLLERRRPGAPGALAPVSDYLAAVGRIVDGPPLAPEETAALLAATADAYRRRHGRDRVPGEPVDTDSLFLQAAAVLGRHDPTLSEYGARQRVVAEFNRRRPRPHPVLLSPEPRFDTRGLEQAPPAVGPRFEHWLTGAVRHWEDITYTALSNTPPDEVPEGAFLPLLVQWLHLGDHRLREGWNGTPIETVLERLGVRLHPAVVEYLRRPERYDPDADPTILSGLFGLVRDWPEPVARPLFRRALEIGWNLAARHLPATPWARLLVQEFAASPYGAPPLARV